MTSVESNPAFNAFEKQLRTLCLKEFPCGGGPWRETKPKSPNKKLKKLKENVESKYLITLKDYGAEHEKTETLQEYVSSKHSPWHLDYSWSEEAKQLREIAVKSPWLIDDNFILSYFKTLRIVDKNVSEVDKELLRFRNLEELTLSANQLITVNSKNLPLSLKVLELCANQISDLSALCVRPPLLIHLGLGMNRISFLGDYLTGDFWPNLLSLDLSHNNLSDLLEVVKKLGTLPKLRNLILQGNPLALIAGYRGYTIDSLRKLNILDDIMISADEKHHYKGLARRREYILDEAKVTLDVVNIKGIPMPEEMKNPEEQQEFPIIERKYFVQFMFLDEAPSKTDIIEVTHDELDRMEGLEVMSTMPSADQSTYSAIPGILNSKSTKVKKKLKMSPAVPEEELDTDVSYTETAKNVNFTSEPDVVNVAREATVEPEKEPSVLHSTPDPKQSDENGAPEKEQIIQAEPEVIKEAPINTNMEPWAEDVQLNWSQAVIRDDLLSLRNFFKQGMNIAVMEEMIECFPLHTPPIPDDRLTSASSKGGRTSASSKGRLTSASSKGRFSSASSRQSKKLCTPANESPEATSPGGGKKDKKKDDKKDAKAKDDKAKGGKKKKEPELELKRGPPSYTTLAKFHIPLEEFLDGEYEFNKVFSKDGAELAFELAASSMKNNDNDKKDGKKDKDKKGKPGSSKKEKGKDTDRSGSSKTSTTSKSAMSKLLSPKNSKKPASQLSVNPSKMKDSRRASAIGKGKDGKKGKGQALMEEDIEEIPPPPPLEIEVKIKLHHWKTAMDSLKDQEEKNKNIEEPTV